MDTPKGNFQIGDIVDERYEILDVLGEGGMGVVYKVQDNLLAQIIALKTLLPAFVKHQEALTRFINEVKVSLMLNHPNIIRVYDIRQKDIIYYMTMQYIDGFSLFDWMQENPQRDLGQVLNVLKKICDGLDYAHQKGTFHRDIKPANIMMTKEGGVFLLDFGLAKLTDGMGNLTRLGGAGTPNYMAPEQKRGGDIDQRTDIFSVGVLAFEMFTGELPKLTMASVLNKNLNENVDQVLTKAMASDPSERYGNVLTFIEDMEEALATKKVLPRQKEDQDAEADTLLDVNEAIIPPDTGPAPNPESIVNMNIVSAGHFWMGSSLEEGKNETEKPRHRLFLATYYIDKYPVTNKAYGAFIKETGYPEPPLWSNPQFSHPSQPVVGVTWFDALEYSKWANKRLPTEAEWEKAAKGQENFIYPWGNEFSNGMANIDSIMDRTSPVDQFDGGISPYGCLDMIGNVWEWCTDWFDDRYYAMSPTENPTGPQVGTKKVLRGGGWDTIYLNARNAFRFFAEPSTSSTNIGFRCVVDG